MAGPAPKRLFPNPFYVILLVASTVFTVTALAYLIGPSIEQRAANRAGGAGAGPASLALTAWLDRRGPLVLAIEIGVMFVAGILAMATDRYFPAEDRSNDSGEGARAPGRDG